MNVKDLTAVETFIVPKHVIAATDETLREAGESHAERFVLWTGTVGETSFRADSAYIPGQTAHALPTGLCVTVPGDELHKLNRWLYENDQTLAVQVHSHPARAYHSDTDDTFPIVTQVGGLSVVVPDFARLGVTGRGVAVYRLGERGWKRIRGRKQQRLLQLETGTL